MKIRQHLPGIGYLTHALIVIGFISSVEISEAATYYVAKTGSDSNTCTNATSQSTPRLTIRGGASCLTAGDTLFVRAGTYAESFQNGIPGGFSWNAPVTISAFGSDTVVIKPSSSVYAVFDLSSPSSQYIILNNLILDGTNTTSEVLKVTDYAHHIRISNSELMNSGGQGILTTPGNGKRGDYNEFLNLKVHNNGPGTGNGVHGLYIATSNNLIQHSEVYQNTAYGICLYSGSADRVSNNIIRSNLIHNNAVSGQGSYGIIVSYGSNNLVYNNIIYGNNGGIVVKYGSPNSNHVYNNTIYSNTNGREGYCINIDTGVVSTDVRNNLCWKNTYGISNQGNGTTFVNNLTTSDPLFKNAPTDFTLLAGSPAIDTGITIGTITDDYAGIPRPIGSAYDIGACEYNGGHSTGGSLNPPSNLITTAN